MSPEISGFTENPNEKEAIGKDRKKESEIRRENMAPYITDLTKPKG